MKFNDRVSLAEEPASARPQTGKVPLATILRQSGFAVGAFGAMTGYFTMMVLMTIGPEAAMSYGHDASQRAFMIQFHMIGMYAPTLMTGFLLQKIGAARLQIAGATCGVVGAVAGATGTSQLSFLVALGLIGISWSLLYVSGSTLIAASYRAESKARTQALGEVVIMGGSAIGGLSSAALLQASGWGRLNLIVAIILVVSGAITICYILSRRLWHKYE